MIPSVLAMKVNEVRETGSLNICAGHDIHNHVIRGKSRHNEVDKTVATDTSGRG